MMTSYLIILVGIQTEATPSFPGKKRNNVRSLKVRIPVGWPMVAKVLDDRSWLVTSK